MPRISGSGGRAVTATSREQIKPYELPLRQNQQLPSSSQHLNQSEDRQRSYIIHTYQTQEDNIILGSD